jgi:hypothetical protein
MAALASLVASNIVLRAVWYAGCLGVHVFGLVLLSEITRADLQPLATWRSRAT